MKKVIIAVLAVLIVVGGGLAIAHNSSKKKSSDATASSNSSKSSSSSTSGDMNATITANDSSATPDTITAKQGQKVNITFKVSKEGTYHGGLDFKNDDLGLDSGSIDEGESKVLSFTATKSFQFTPYWYKSNVKKDYFVTVDVQ